MRPSTRRAQRGSSDSALAEQPYGEAMAGTLKKAFPCGRRT